MASLTVTIAALVLLVCQFDTVHSWLSQHKKDPAKEYKRPGSYYGDPNSIGVGLNSYQPLPKNGDVKQPDAASRSGGASSSGGGYGSANDYGSNFGHNYANRPGSQYGRPAPLPSIDDDYDEPPMEDAFKPKLKAKCRPFYSLNCERFCPAGNAIDAEECQTCDCCPVLKCQGECSYGVVRHNGCDTCNCKTPPNHIIPNCPRKWCTKECKLGFAKDRNGCPLCKCNRRQFKTRWHTMFQ